MKIIPAILPLRYDDIERNVEKVAHMVDTVQIDFVDGHFAPNRTWMFDHKDEAKLDDLLHESIGLPFWESMNYEFDLMVQNPLDHVERFIALGPSKIIFHLEALDQEKTVSYFENLPSITKELMTFGIAIGLDTDPAGIAPYIPYIDTIQCMGIAQVGFQGQQFDARVIDQIKKVKELYPDKHISVDGAVNTENASSLAHAGADTLVVGSAIFQSNDVEGTIQALQWPEESSVQEN